MREFRFALIAFFSVCAAAGISYFIAMRAGGSINLSSNTQDWGSFGSYIGGILAPAASFLAGYMVYKSFALSAYQQKLLLMRETISRLDLVMESKINAPFNNLCYGEEYRGHQFRNIIYAISNNKIEANEGLIGATLSLLHNIAITADSVRYYVGLLGKFPSNEKDSHVLRDLEISYWTEKYSAICSVMVRVVGQAEFEKKVSPEQLKSFKLVLGGGNGA